MGLAGRSKRKMSEFTYLPTDEAWSKAVKERDNYHCRWFGCTLKGTQAAHAIARWNPALKLALEDGVTLCATHHRILDHQERLRRRETLKLLLGKTLFDRLFKASYKIFLWMDDKEPVHHARVKKEHVGRVSSMSFLDLRNGSQRKIR